MKIELAVFDLAGTTVKDNQDVQRVLQQTLSKFDTYITLDEARAVMGLPKPVAIRQLLRSYSDDLEMISNDRINSIHQVFVEDMIAFYREDSSVTETEGVSETFQILKQNGVKVAIDTGFDRAITNVLLTRLGWIKNGLLDGNITSDEVMRGRPYPDMIFTLMERLNINDPSLVAKIGDTASDLQEGNAAGCGLVVGVTSGAYSRAMLEQKEHTHLIDSIPEILSILNFRKSALTV